MFITLDDVISVLKMVGRKLTNTFLYMLCIKKCFGLFTHTENMWENSVDQLVASCDCSLGENTNLLNL